MALRRVVPMHFHYGRHFHVAEQCEKFQVIRYTLITCIEPELIKLEWTGFFGVEPHGVVLAFAKLLTCRLVGYEEMPKIVRLQKGIRELGIRNALFALEPCADGILFHE